MMHFSIWMSSFWWHHTFDILMIMMIITNRSSFWWHHTFDILMKMMINTVGLHIMVLAYVQIVVLAYMRIYMYVCGGLHEICSKLPKSSPGRRKSPSSRPPHPFPG